MILIEDVKKLFAESLMKGKSFDEAFSICWQEVFDAGRGARPTKGKTFVTNNKKGTKYEVIYDDATDATNERDGESCVVYRSETDGQIYVREKEEFWVKFSVEGN